MKNFILAQNAREAITASRAFGHPIAALRIRRILPRLHESARSASQDPGADSCWWERIRGKVQKRMAKIVY